MLWLGYFFSTRASKKGLSFSAPSCWFWEPLVHAIRVYPKSAHPDCVSNSINMSLYQTSSSVKRESDMFSSTSLSVTKYFTAGSRSAISAQPAILRLLHDDMSHINNLLRAFTSVPVVISKQRKWFTQWTPQPQMYPTFLWQKSLALYLTQGIKGSVSSAENCCGEEKKRTPQKQVGEHRKGWWDGNGSHLWLEHS